MVCGVAFPRPVSAAKCTQQVQSWHGWMLSSHLATVPITPWASAVPWFSCPLPSVLCCDWQGPALPGRKGLCPFNSSPCLSAAHSQSPWGPRGCYKLQTGFAILYWIPIVISNSFWWQRNRTHLVPNQVFLVPANLSCTLQHWWGISVMKLQWKLCLLKRIALWVLNPSLEPCACLESELTFFHGVGNYKYPHWVQLFFCLALPQSNFWRISSSYVSTTCMVVSPKFG